MLVIEGGDCVGKSTFAKACVALLHEARQSHQLAHLSRPAPTWDSYNNYLERMSVNTVWDRFHLSELAYRQHDDRKSLITPLKWDLVEAAFRQHAGFMVVLVATEEEIRARHEQRGDEMYDIEHIVKVNESFDEMTQHPWVNVRGRVYQLRVDACGSVTGNGHDFAAPKLEPAEIVCSYLERLVEFVQL